MWYRIFAEVDSDPEHEWEKLAADSYRTLNDLSARSGNTTGLPPDWILIQKGTGKPIEADLYINNVSRNHGFDAFRTLWRVSLDYEWFNSSDAEIYLSRVNRYLLPYYKANGDLPTVISPSGEALSWQGSIANDAGYLAALMRTEDPQTGIKFHDKFITSKLASDGTYWGSGWNYYDANWAWFGTALFNHNLPNLWNFEIQY
jgi:endoglucanase